MIRKDAPKGSINLNSFRSGRIVSDGNFSCYKEVVDGRECSFKIDTGSDLS